MANPFITEIQAALRQISHQLAREEIPDLDRLQAAVSGIVAEIEHNPGQTLEPAWIALLDEAMRIHGTLQQHSADLAAQLMKLKSHRNAAAAYVTTPKKPDIH